MLAALAPTGCVPPANVTFPGAATVADPTDIAVGKALYEANCLSCHKADGKGPPSVVGRSFDQLRTVENDGLMAMIKAMPDSYVKALAAYLGSLGS